MPTRRVANPVQTADLIEDARRAGFPAAVRLLAARMGDLADQAAALPPGDPGRAVALSSVLLLVAEVTRIAAAESVGQAGPR